MVEFTLRAARQIEDLLNHCIEEEKYAGYRSLLSALREARDIIESAPNTGRPYPSTYVKIARWRFLWLRKGNYWFGWSNARGYPVITNVFFVTAHMSRRVEPDEGQTNAPYR